MLRTRIKSITLVGACLLLSRCYISAVGVWCDDPAPSCPSGLYCDGTNHCAVGAPDAGAGSTDAGEVADGGPGDAGERKADAGSSDGGTHPAPDAGRMGEDAGPIDAGPPVCGFDPSCSESGVPTCATRCTGTEICDLTGHCQSPRYLTSDAGTVMDEVTGLTWQQDTPSNECTDTDGFCNLADAQTYCAGLQLGAFSSGWMIPTVNQLFSLIQGCIGTDPQLIGSAFTNSSSNMNPYWSSQLNSTQGANWVVQFTTADVGPAPSNTTGAEAVRCVHP